MDRPFASVIVPTRDRPGSLAGCLEALSAQTYEHDLYEVLVVDDRSREPLDGLVAEFRTRMEIRLLAGEGSGPAAARNAGTRAARGDVLAFTDDDCAPRPEWLAALVRRTEPVAGVGGPTVNRLPSNLCSTASQILIDHLCAYYNAPGLPGRFFTTSNLALPARGFREVGGFAAGFGHPGGEDRELCDRWIRSGRRILWEPRALVDHDHPLTLPKFWDQHVRYGRGARLFHRARVADGAGRPMIEPPGFYLGLLARPFRIGSARPLRITALLALSQFAHAFGYLVPASRACRGRPV